MYFKEFDTGFELDDSLHHFTQQITKAAQPLILQERIGLARGVVCRNTSIPFLFALYRIRMT